MERRKFLQRISLGAIGALLVPKELFSKNRKPYQKPQITKKESVEDELLKEIFKDADLNREQGKGLLYLALFTSGEFDGRDSDTDQEVSYKEYARQPIATRDEVFNGLFGRFKRWRNRKDITFPTCGDGAATVTGFKVFAPGGAIFESRLASPVHISTGVTPQFNKGELQIALDEDDGIDIDFCDEL